MKFTLVDNIQKDKTLSLILKGLVVFIFFYLIADILVMKSQLGITIDALKTTLFGNEEEFLEPITEGALLELWHTQIFFIMMILLTLNAIFIRLAKRKRVLLTNILMLSAITSLIALPLSYYISELFVSIYLVSFFIWHILAIWMSIFSLWKLRA